MDPVRGETFGSFHGTVPGEYLTFRSGVNANGGIASQTPVMVTGTTRTPARCAIENGPRLNSPSRPLLLLVPSVHIRVCERREAVNSDASQKITGGRTLAHQSNRTLGRSGRITPQDSAFRGSLAEGGLRRTTWFGQSPMAYEK